MRVALAPAGRALERPLFVPTTPLTSGRKIIVSLELEKKKCKSYQGRFFIIGEKRVAASFFPASGARKSAFREKNELLKDARRHTHTHTHTHTMGCVFFKATHAGGRDAEAARTHSHPALDQQSGQV